MDAVAAQMKAEWELGMSPLPTIRFRSKFRFTTRLITVLISWASEPGQDGQIQHQIPR